MTTPRIRFLVSLAAVLTVSLVLSGCASGHARPASAELAAADGLPLTIRFDNGAREFVHVYLIGEQREWLLGRVEPGAKATLRIPEAALDGNPGTMRLAVLAGQRVTFRAAAEARAALTVTQPTTELLRQRWMFSLTPTRGQLTSLPLGELPR